MNRHRREETAILDPSVLARVLAVGAFVLSAVCAAMGVATATSDGAGATADPCPPVTAPWRADPAPMTASDPVAITVDRIDACSSLVPVGVDDRRRIEVPSVHTPEQAGWYRHGPTPGERGPAVVVGHVDGDGRRGVFADLADATAGDRITITRRDGSHAVFTVTGTVQVSRNWFPTRDVYGDTAGAELRLITAGGALDPTGRSREDNVIVYATLTGRG
ncbi:sortase family protein [Actinomycetospora succinea]|uniref:Sortase family protein n=1 Tax=Actinomycetospora succinea TaxID=663603 RepID=A0A4V3D8H1_9PSEU|nr:class F sortase [Actinomycetospora succinea]TDQ51747.1 sortase family protein [Actinomycetospora succinea]